MFDTEILFSHSEGDTNYYDVYFKPEFPLQKIKVDIVLKKSLEESKKTRYDIIREN